MIPVLEIGGSHVTFAIVDLSRDARVTTMRRIELTPSSSPEETVDQILSATDPVATPPGAAWAIAIPGPFDYREGIGRFTGVGKFDELNGYDLRTALFDRLRPRPRELTFLNDADAFAVGESLSGASRGADRSVLITLGSGVGSAFVADGRIVKSGAEVPPHGEAYRLRWAERPIEDSVSRRAIRARYRGLTGTDADVHEIAVRARDGEAAASTAIDQSL